uniref:Putative secreted protein n=1 Tax=Anopheles darlingi TaxID=43151 RepID=A0A2M4D7L2_ANODA
MSHRCWPRTVRWHRLRVFSSMGSSWTGLAGTSARCDCRKRPIRSFTRRCQSSTCTRSTRPRRRMRSCTSARCIRRLTGRI